MSPPTPLNDPAKDEMFDRGLEKLLAGDMSGLEDIDPELHDTALTMVGLASDAGWIGSEPAPPPQETRPWWTRHATVLSRIAAVLVVGMVAGIGALAWQLVSHDPPGEQIEFSYVSEEQEAASTGVCDREPRTAEEIARIVSDTSASSEPSTTGDPRSFSEIKANLTQLTRDWNACLVNGEYDRARAYESENLLRTAAHLGGYDPSEDLYNEQIATMITYEQRRVEPMAHGEDVEIEIYTINWSRSPKIDPDLDRDETAPVGAEGFETAAAELWMVPVDPSGDWVEWPTVITYVYEDGQWMIDLHDREGSPATPVPEPDSR